jgi:hypothetical protein
MKGKQEPSLPRRHQPMGKHIPRAKGYLGEAAVLLGLEFL